MSDDELSKRAAKYSSDIANAIENLKYQQQHPCGHIPYLHQSDVIAEAYKAGFLDGRDSKDMEVTKKRKLRNE